MISVVVSALHVTNIQQGWHGLRYCLNMRFIFLLLAIISCSVGQAQIKSSPADKFVILTAKGAQFGLFKRPDESYFFSYQNGMSSGIDLRKIRFRNKKEAEIFIKKIGKAFSAQDGTSFLVSYPKYKIRLLTEMGVVFMIVNETGLSPSTFRITKENYTQVNIL
jgi:hypothetical protein